MASKITNYQCPACSGPLHFDGESGKLECEYCGSTYDIVEIEQLYAEKMKEAESAAAQEKAHDPAAYTMPEDTGGDWEFNTAGDENWGEEGEGMKAYNCPSCGAELICDANTAATSCPYCGNPTVVPGNFAGTLKPDYIIPFKLDKTKAIHELCRYYRGKKFLPKAFADNNHIDEIKGVYVPFWLYDGEACADVNYTATKEHTTTTRRERITTTEHYQVRRAGSVSFEKIPVDASSKMPDDHMDAIEPYNFNELKPFSTAYMPGFLADKYDLSAEKCAERADERAKKSALEAMSKTVTGYNSVTVENQDVRIKKGKVKYAMMPVWLLSTRWKGKSFLFAMNGQTGKLVGDLPVDKGRYWSWFAGIAVPAAALMILLCWLI